MASTKCSVNGCKRDLDTLCAHCQSNFCTKHYFEHAKIAYDQLVPLADQLNGIINSIQQLNPIYQAHQQLDQWRETSHRQIEELYNEKKQQIKVEVEQKVEKQMNQLRELSRQVRELIDEGDASFKQIENIQRGIDECQEQCKQFGEADHTQLKLKPIEIDMSLDKKELFTGGGTLLSLEQQIKLNELYGKNEQRWMLVYKATRDGFDSSDFHRCCNNQGPTITVIQSQKGGYLFGGYTSVSWRSRGHYVVDNYGPFLFTLTNPHRIVPTKYPIKLAEYTIYDHDSYGPIFGGGFDCYVCDDRESNGGGYFGFPHSYIDTTNHGKTTFTGNQNFRTCDIEVYRLLTN